MRLGESKEHARNMHSCARKIAWAGFYSLGHLLGTRVWKIYQKRLEALVMLEETSA